MKRSASALLALLSLSACTDEVNSRRALQDYGFSSVETGGYSWFACHDMFATKFTAVNPVGRKVSGVVCCNWKGCTVRF